MEDYKKEELEKLHELKDRFLSLVAHDLIGPSGTIENLLQLILSDEECPLPIKHRRKIELVIKSAKKINQLITEILKITRFKSGRVKLVPKNINIYSLIKNILQHNQSFGEDKRIKLINKVPEDLRAFVDPLLFNQVLENVLNNAFKYSSPGAEIKVFIRENSKNIIAIQDHGAGIGPEKLARIFDYDPSISSKGTMGEIGFGLGLSLSRDIMLAHGGDITVQSEEGKGSTFYIRLPMEKPKILIVDDEEIFREEQRAYFRNINVDVLEAENGVVALRKAREMRPNLIITDVMMPVRDGFELIKDLKDDPETRNIPIIVVSGVRGKDIREEAFRSGADDFVQKPFESDELIPRVKRFVEIL